MGAWNAAGDWDEPDDLEAAIWQAMYRWQISAPRPVDFVADVLKAASSYALAPVITLPARPAVRAATGLDDPGLLYAACPVSAPKSWIDEYDQGEL